MAPPSASSSGPTFDVFLNFRGEDTRKTFTGHLYNGLDGAKIRTFIDSENLHVGEDIGEELLSAIQRSKISIPIFSKKYAESKWCLKELAKIVECSKTRNQLVLPIFYDVDPSDVRHSTTYEGALQKHRESFDQKIIDEWRQALKKVGGMKGWELKNIADGHEATLVREVVAKVSSKLIKDSQIVSDNLVGIQSHVAEMMSLLNIKSEDEDVKIVGVWGLGGIGKTTIAKFVYNEISHYFEGCSFLENVQESSKHYRGLSDLQNQLVTDLLKGESFKITTVNEGINVISKRFRKMKVLIVLDDVEEKIQLDAFIKKRDWFGSGSRIIITTRDAGILTNAKVGEIYEPSEMDASHSLQLFSKCAFRSDHTPDDFLNLSKEIVRITGGLPLALEVIGSSLSETDDISEWEETLERLRYIPHDNVEKKLKISYDGLTRFEKAIFLDIACFCNGMDKNIACFVWKKRNFSPKSGIRVLCQKSLVKIGENNELKMHDQLKDLGKGIVFEENNWVPGERSRLWSHEEALKVLEKRTGTDKVEVLCIDFGDASSGQSYLTSEGFAKMNGLKLLQVDYAQFAPGFEPPFSELIWLRWKGCPLDFRLKNFHPENLVVLDLSYSLVGINWTGWNSIKEAKNLKVLNLTGCKNLSKIPQVSRLEVLILENCVQLECIDESIEFLERLVTLNMRGCSELKNLPYGIGVLSSLRNLNLHQCVKLENLPESIATLLRLETFDASFCYIKDGGIPDAIRWLSSLKILKLGGNDFLSLPMEVSSLSLLQTLDLRFCDKLESLLELPSSLKYLNVLRCTSLKSLPGLSNLTDLEVLCLDGCKNLKELKLPGFSKLCEIEGLEGLDSLELLTIKQCRSLRTIPKLSNLKKLRVVEVEGCEQLLEIEGFVGLDSLDQLIISWCKSLKKMPDLSDLKLLRELEVEGCKQLLKIEGIGGLDSLELLTIRRCNSLEKIPDLSNLRNLKCRTIAECPMLKEIQGLKKLKSLDRHEGTLVRKVVEEVSSMLIKDSKIVSGDLVGIQSHVAKMKCLLNIKSEDENVKIVGVCGLGGIGKTTIAKVVYNTISHHFEGCSFLENVQETSQHYSRGLIDLQNQLVTNLLKEEFSKITNVDQGINVIKERFCKMKVLIVLDDVEEISQLEKFIKKRGWFGSGSRIIITTRDVRILDNAEVDEIYEPSGMDAYHSLQLFSKCAFRSEHTPDDFLNLSKEIVRTTGGLPLALEVIGSSLSKMDNISEWEKTLERLRYIPHDKVQKKLKISYDSLTDSQKAIFLDIAYFCNGMDKNIACFVWKKCNFFPESGIEVLCQKSLVKIGENDELKMHDQLKDLGKEIVRQENLKVPGERSRLWSHKEALEVLEEYTGTKNVEGLCIDFGGSSSGQSCLTSEGFSKMNRLRLLQVDYAQFALDFEPSFSELIWFRWKGCPLDFRLKNFHPVNLVVLDLSYSLVSFDWTGWDHIKVAKNLKVLNLTGCQHLSKIPQLGLVHLEVLILENCVNLVDIEESIDFLKGLVTLNMRGCTKLKDLPYGIWGLTSLKNLNLHQCEALEKLPDSIATLGNLETFDASFCYIKDGGIPAVCPSSLKILRLGGNDFHSLPMEVSSLSFLQTLDLWFCYKLESLPELPSSLKYLNVLRCRSLKSLPWLSNLTNLEVLCLDDCENLVEMPALLGLKNLVRLNLDNCHSLTEIGSLVGLDSLKLFAIKNCKSLRKIGKMSSLRKLEEIRLADNSMLCEIEGLERLDSLELLTINRCTSLRKILKLSYLKKLTVLEVDICKQLLEIEGAFVDLDSLDRLTIKWCTSLRKIPRSSDMKKLTVLEVIGCKQLLEIKGDFVGLDSLDWLTIKLCTSLRTIPDLSYLKKLTVLEVDDCKQLLEIEGSFVGLDSLDRLTIKCCRSLRKIPNLSDLKKLTVLEVYSCEQLLEIEGDFVGLDSLDWLTIKLCRSLRKIPKLSYLKKLTVLEVHGCEQLLEIEGSFVGLDSLDRLIINQCTSLRKIPKLCDLKKLTVLEVHGCKQLLEIEDNFVGLDSLNQLTIKWCRSLRKIPKLSDLKKVKVLEVDDCEQLLEIEGDFVGLDSLDRLTIYRCTSLRKIPKLSDLKKLTVLEVNGCEQLLEIDGDFVGLDSLDKLTITLCKSLRKIPRLSYLKKLTVLEVFGCEQLLEIEGGFVGLDSLDRLSIYCCTSLRKIPKLFDLKKLTVLRVGHCEQLLDIEGGFVGLDSLDRLTIYCCKSLRKIPKLSDLKKLTVLEVNGCEQLLEIEGDFMGLDSLDQLSISLCTSLRKIPKLSYLKKLTVLSVHHYKQLLDIEGDFVGLDSLDRLTIYCCTSLRKIPKLCDLKKLTVLEVNGCEQLLEIEGDFVGLDSLDRLIINQCTSLRKIPKLSDLKKLTVLEVHGCEQLLEIEGGFVGLDSLDRLTIKWCKSLRKIPNLSDLKKLKVLEVDGCEQLLEIEGDFVGLDSLDRLTIRRCESLIKVPELSDLKLLRKLELEGCEELLKIESIVGLESLETLGVRMCGSMRRLLDLSSLRNLKRLFISSWPRLEDIQGLDKLESLEILNIRDCNSMDRLPDLSYLRNLKDLVISSCPRLEDIQGLDNLESLEILNITECNSMERLPDLSYLRNLKCVRLNEIRSYGPPYIEWMHTRREVLGMKGKRDSSPELEFRWH